MVFGSLRGKKIIKTRIKNKSRRLKELQRVRNKPITKRLGVTIFPSKRLIDSEIKGLKKDLKNNRKKLRKSR